MTEKMERTFGSFAPRAANYGRTVPMMLAALSMYHSGIPQIVLAGDPTGDDMRALARVVYQAYLPSSVVVPAAAHQRQATAELLPWIRAMDARDGRATAYVCRDFTCQLPATSGEELASQLKANRT
jgi:uncharacterized protein YyaL (SSP411 family)